MKSGPVPTLSAFRALHSSHVLPRSAANHSQTLIRKLSASKNDTGLSPFQPICRQAARFSFLPSLLLKMDFDREVYALQERVGHGELVPIPNQC